MTSKIKILTLLLSLTIASCTFETGDDDQIEMEEMDNTEEENEDMGGGGDTGNSSSSFFESIYTHSINIEKFAIANNLIAVHDGQKLTISLDGSSQSFATVVYPIDGQTLEADLSSILSIRGVGGEIHIGTEDGHYLVHDGDSFRGFPIIVYKMKPKGNKLWAIWEGNPTYFSNELPGRYQSEIEIDESSGEFFLDEGMCVDFPDFSNNLCIDYTLTDLAIGAYPTNIALSESQNMILFESGGSGIFELEFNMGLLPFNKIKEIDWVFWGSTDDDDNRYHHLWARTDSGLAIYPMESNLDNLNPSENNWFHINKDNSGLLTNNVEQLELFSIDRLIGFSNSPNPAFYYINGNTGAPCYYTNTNGIDSSNGNITYITTDFVSQGTGYAYFSQGKDIFIIPYTDLVDGCGF